MKKHGNRRQRKGGRKGGPEEKRERAKETRQGRKKTKRRKGKKTLHAVGGGLPDVRVYKVIDIEFELYDQRVT